MNVNKRIKKFQKMIKRQKKRKIGDFDRGKQTKSEWKQQEKREQKKLE